jgi:hypothetical protein
VYLVLAFRRVYGPRVLTSTIKAIAVYAAFGVANVVVAFGSLITAVMLMTRFHEN